MELTARQIHSISVGISIADIKAYINAHTTEYEEFLKQENEEKA